MKIRIKDPKDIKIESDKICIKGRKMRCGVQTEIPIEQAYMHFEDLEDKTIVVYGKNKGNAGNGAVVFDKNTMEMKSQFDRKDIHDLVAFDRGILMSKAPITKVGKARIIKQMLSEEDWSYPESYESKQKHKK